MKHSKAYLEKQESLKEKEQSLRTEIDNDTARAERSVISVLKTSGYILAGLGIGYLAYKSLYSSKATPDKKKKKKEKDAEVSVGQLNPFVSKILDQVITLGVNALSDYLSGLKQRKSKDS